MEYEITQVELVEQPSAVVRGTVARDGIAGFLGGVFGEVMGVIASQGRRPAGMPFGCYVPAGDGFEVEAGFPTDAPVNPSGRVVPSVVPGGPVLQVLHQGSYDGVVAAYRAAESWLTDHDAEATAPPWESYLDGPDVAQPRTLVCVPYRQR